MSDEVRDYYDQNCINELRRLDDPYNRIEFFSTLYIIKKYFPDNGVILILAQVQGDIQSNF